MWRLKNPTTTIQYYKSNCGVRCRLKYEWDRPLLLTAKINIGQTPFPTKFPKIRTVTSVSLLRYLVFRNNEISSRLIRGASSFIVFLHLYFLLFLLLPLFVTDWEIYHIIICKNNFDTDVWPHIRYSIVNLSSRETNGLGSRERRMGLLMQWRRN